MKRKIVSIYFNCARKLITKLLFLLYNANRNSATNNTHYKNVKTLQCHHIIQLHGKRSGYIAKLQMTFCLGHARSNNTLLSTTQLMFLQSCETCQENPGMLDLGTKWVRLFPNGTHSGLIQIRLQHNLTRRAKMY